MREESTLHPSFATVAMLLRDLLGVSLSASAPDEFLGLVPEEATLFFRGQFFSASLLERFAGQLKPGEPTLAADVLGIQWLFLRLEALLLCMGPFVTQKPRREECAARLARSGIGKDHQDAFHAYVSQLPLIGRHQLDGIAVALAHQFGDRPCANVRMVDLDPSEEERARMQSPQLPFSKYIETVHDTEAIYMQEITMGNATAAKTALHRIQQYHSGRNSATPEDLIGAKFGLAISRTLARIAARNAGVPANVLDDTIAKYLERIWIATDAQILITAAHDLTDEFCQLVQFHRSRNYSPVIRRTVAYVLNHFHDPLTVGEIADFFGMNRTYLSGKFHSEVGQTISEYICSVRLEYAARLLPMNNLSIHDVCAAAGIPDQSYFTKRFREAYGLTPTQYRHNANRSI